MSESFLLPAVALAICTRGDDVAVIERMDETLTFPGGKIEPNETGAEAALRELEEETGLRGSHPVFLGSRKHPVTGTTASYFWVPEPEGTATCREPDKHRRVLWIRSGELPVRMTHDLYPGAEDLLNRLPFIFIGGTHTPERRLTSADGWTIVKKAAGLVPL